jgi:hypothetical protein
MYFTANYLEYGKRGIYRTRMLINEHGDTILTSKEKEITIPSETKLFPAYPNPFNPVTNISFTIDRQTEIELTVFDILGNEVKRILKEEKKPGDYTVQFNCMNLNSGIYFANLKTKFNSLTTKLLFIK